VLSVAGSSATCSGRSRPSSAVRASAAAPLQVEEQLPPGLRTLAHAVDQADELLLALGRGSDDDQQALRGILEPGLHVDAVDHK
jgi:hypothetical protein